MPKSRLLPGCAAAMLMAVTSCHRVSERMEITESRELSLQSPPVAMVAASADRFALAENVASATLPAPKENPLSWTTPESWKEAPAGSDPSGMRLIDLRFGPNGEGECYLAIIQGTAGGLEANVNRWRGQMGLPPMSVDELAKLPKKMLVNRESSFVSFDGDYKGVGATAAAKDWRMMGLLQQAPEFMLFVKIIGPKELVIKNEAAFEQFAQSIGVKR
ncbi:MAG: hypothetical protein WCN98_08620 [Verrucomicrobiaceae bacterium]